MEPTAIAILAGTAANAFVLLGGLALWLSYRTRRLERAQDLERLERLEERRRLLEPVETRLAELTRAVEHLGVEVERMSEAQRYSARLGQPGPTPARLEQPQGGPAPRIVTPH